MRRRGYGEARRGPPGGRGKALSTGHGRLRARRARPCGPLRGSVAGGPFSRAVMGEASFLSKDEGLR